MAGSHQVISCDKGSFSAHPKSKTPRAVLRVLSRGDLLLR